MYSKIATSTYCKNSIDNNRSYLSCYNDPHTVVLLTVSWYRINITVYIIYLISTTNMRAKN